MKTVSIDEATEQLESLAQLALRGEPVLIELDSGVVVLQGHHPFEPLPPGALNDVYTEEEIRQDNLFAKRSVIPLDPEP